ncbi:MAG: substrate-binding domain-containing protein [Armatimonadota bacterium]
MHRRLLLGMTLAAGLCTGCIRETAPPAANTGGEPGAASASAVETRSKDETLEIAVVPKGLTHQFWQTIRAGAEEAGKDVNARILWNGPKSETEIQDQIDILKNYASQGVDGIAVAATNAKALARPVEELDAQKIPVVVIDSGVESQVPRSFIATDNVEAAKLAAKEMGRLLGGKGKVAVLSFLKGAGTSDERERGFLEGIKEFPGIEVLEPVETKSDSARAADQMETLITHHPDLAGVFASNEPNVVGAAKVIQDKGLAGKVKLIGFDASDPEIEYLQRGVVQAIVVQDPFKMGYEGVKALAQILRGEGTPNPRIDTGATVVTQENLDDPKVQKLLYPLGKK